MTFKTRHQWLAYLFFSALLAYANWYSMRYGLFGFSMFTVGVMFAAYLTELVKDIKKGRE